MRTILERGKTNSQKVVERRSEGRRLLLIMAVDKVTEICPGLTPDNLDLYKSTASMLTTSQYSEQQRARFADKIK